MAQVSRRKLSPDIHDHLVELLISVLGTSNQTKSGLLFTHSLLSNTELTMLAKRVGIALLLKKKYQYQQIQDYLKVSKGTIAKVATILITSDKESQVVLDNILHEKQINQVLGKIDYFIGGMLPPKGGNWKEWRKDLENDRRKNEQPI